MSSQPARRTVVITGRPDEVRSRPLREAAARPSSTVVSLPGARGPRIVQIDRRRPPRRPVERLGPRPDRIAMWAVVMALFLVLVTILSSH
jgi:hypothetical protein